jgi:hypothetical protein
MNAQVISLQNQVSNLTRRMNEYARSANANARAVREWEAHANQLQAKINKLTPLVQEGEFYRKFIDDRMLHIKQLTERSCDPGDEALREYSFLLYVIELVGADYYSGFLGKDGYGAIETMARGLYDGGTGMLSIAKRREINLKLMVRAEYQTFAKITKKLCAFQTKVLEALTMQPGHHPELRDPRIVDVVLREVKGHNEWIAKLEAQPKRDMRLRDAWEAQRLAWWKKHAAYEKDDHCIPWFSAMLKKNPDIRVDDFHAGGRIARDAGIHINRLEPTKYYTDDTVAVYENSPNAFAPQNMML